MPAQNAFYQTGLKRCFAIGTIILIGWTNDADAQDYDGNNAFQTAGNVGTWYLRGDISFSSNDPYDISSNGEFDRTKLGGTLGFGFRFNENFRVDGQFGLIGQHAYGGGRYTTTCRGTWTDTFNLTGEVLAVYEDDVDCKGEDEGQASNWEASANAYWDLGRFGAITPYVGAGLGVAISSYEAHVNLRHCRDQFLSAGFIDSTFTCPEERQSDSSVDEIQFSLLYSLSAGFAMAVTDNMEFDFGYRYVSAPRAVYTISDGSGDMLGEGVDSHQFRVGLRYEIW